MIRFLDIYKQDKKLHKNILRKIHNLFNRGDFILGKEVKIFEKNFTNFVDQNMPLAAQMAQMLLH